MKKIYKFRMVVFYFTALLLTIVFSKAAYSQEKLSSAGLPHQTMVTKSYSQPFSNERVLISNQSQEAPGLPQFIQTFNIDETPLVMQAKTSVPKKGKTNPAQPEGSLPLNENVSGGSMMPTVVCGGTPIGTYDLYVTATDRVLSIAAPGFLANDIDLEGETITAIYIADNVDNGTLSAFADGSFIYTPNTGFTGTDEFQYVMQDASGNQSDPVVVTIEVHEAGNRTPIGTPDAFGALAGTTLAISLPGFLANDIDPDGDAITAIYIADNVDHGSLSAFADGSFNYAPNAGFTGTDQFQYVMQDAYSNQSDAITVTIDVNEGNRPPVGTEDLFGAVLNTSLSISAPGFLANDIDQDGDAITAIYIADNVDHGSLSAFADGSFNYTPNAGFTGTDQFQYVMQDALGNQSGPIMVNLEVLGAGDLPIGFEDLYKAADGDVFSIAAPGFLINDVDQNGEALSAIFIADNVDHGLLSAFADGSFNYTPDAGFTGTDQFQYVMQDASGNQSDPVTVTIEVRENDNRTPIGTDDAYGALAGMSLSVAAPGFLMNDIDQDGDAITAIYIADNVDHGTLSAFADGSFNYTPNDGFTGTDQFQYVMQDANSSQSDAITVTIQVYEGNRAPTGTEDSYAVVKNTTLSIAAGGFLVNDYDPDGDALTATFIVDNVDHGSLSAFADGSFNYTPEAGFIGTDQFQYQMQDAYSNSSDPVTVILDVVGPNQPPVASESNITEECEGTGGTIVTLDASNTTDPEDGALTYTWYENYIIIAGPTSSSTFDVVFSTGAHQVLLHVEDECGQSSEIEFTVEVEDTSPPLVDAAFLDAGSPHMYEISTSSSDVCTEIISTTSLILIPELINPIVTLKNNKNVYSLDIDLDRNTVIVKAPNAAAFWAMVSSNGGVNVTNGQVINAKYDLNKYKFGFDSYGNLLSVKGEIITLLCTATDINGNTGEGEATLTDDFLKSIFGSLADSDEVVSQLWNRNYPNPFNQSTTIEFKLEEPAFVKVAIFDQMGRIVEELESMQMQAGVNKVTWDASNFNSGMYYYRINYNGMQVTNKMFLTRQ